MTQSLRGCRPAAAEPELSPATGDAGAWPAGTGSWSQEKALSLAKPTCQAEHTCEPV